MRLFSAAGQTKLASRTGEAGAGLLLPWEGGGEGAGKESAWAWLAAAAGGLGLFLLRKLFSMTGQLFALHSSKPAQAPRGSLIAWQPAAKAPA